MTHKFNLHFMGGFGNCCFQYAFARGYCERHGLRLHTDPWIGQRIFQLDDPPCERELSRRDEFTLNLEGEGDVSYRSYSQQQKCINFYTATKAREWLRFRPEIVAALEWCPMPEIVAHRRCGDYPGYGYVVVSAESYVDALLKFKPDAGAMVVATDNDPTLWPAGMLPGLEFLPDFWMMLQARTLFRGNSTFSWWASVLGGAETFSPIIDGKEGGEIPKHCEFVLGNWPRFANLEFVTDLHLKP